MFFNKYVKKLKPYKVTSHKAWEAAGDSILKLDWNESTIPPTPKVKKELTNYIENGLMNWYPDVDNQKLRSLLSMYSDVNTDQVEYFASSDALHEYIIRAFINPDDVITLISPTYDNFRAAAESIGATIDYFQLDPENDFSFSFARFKDHVENVIPKIVYLCNPNNPTGTTYSVELLEQLVHRFNDVLFIIDEAYYEFVGITAAQLATSYENVVICRTFSKAFGLASFRIGYAISSEHNIVGLRKIRNPKNISSYSQLAAIAALSDIRYMQNYVDEVLKSKEFLKQELKELDIPIICSDGGNFLLVTFGEQQFYILTELEKTNIFLRNYGHVPGMAKYTRITVGTHEQMVYLIESLRRLIL